MREAHIVELVEHAIKRSSIRDFSGERRGPIRVSGESQSAQPFGPVIVKVSSYANLVTVLFHCAISFWMAMRLLLKLAQRKFPIL